MWKVIFLKKSYKIVLILGTLYALMPNVSASDINVSINQSQKEEKLDEKKSKVSYYTVKDYESFRYAVETAKSGSVIILVGTDINGDNSDLNIENKELTIVSNNCSRRIKFKNINVRNGTLNLGIPGTKSPSELHVTSRFTLNNSSLNLYDGAYINGYEEVEYETRVVGNSRGAPITEKVPRFNGKYLLNACNTDSKINLYGGEITNNSFCGLIDGGSKSTLTVDGTKIKDNYLYGGVEPKRIYNFIFKTGIVKNLPISTEKATILGGELSALKTNCATVSGNPSINDLQCTSASISGGNFVSTNGKDIKITGGYFNNVDAKSTSLSGKVIIKKLVSDKITVDGKLDDSSSINVSLKDYNINNKKKVFDVSNGIKVRDVFHNFKIARENYFINNKGCLDDTPSYKYELIDDSSGIKIESDSNIIHVKRGEESKATFTICQPGDSDKENVYHLNFYINDKLMESSDVTNTAIYVPYVASKLDLNKLNSLKIYDTNNEEITNCSKTVKSVDGNLYYHIAIK